MEPPIAWPAKSNLAGDPARLKSAIGGKTESKVEKPAEAH
jgi:hypothetical protein